VSETEKALLNPELSALIVNCRVSSPLSEITSVVAPIPASFMAVSIF
jgi:hypothetical protein